MTDIRKLLGVDDVAGGKKEKGKDAGGKESAPKAKTEQRAVSVSESEAGDSRQVTMPVDEDEEMSDAESTDFAQFDSRLAPDSEDEGEGEDDDAASDDVSDGGVHLRGRSDMSISRSPSPDTPPTKKSKSAKATAAPVTSTTFLPSLMGGYFSGSESEPEDVDGAEPPRRKNRMGQQARRALWEKKYGSGANHVKSQQDQQRRGGRDNGWDMRRGATDGSEGPRGRRGQTRGASGRSQQYTDRPQRRPPAQKKPEDNKPLHPSWEAAKRAKEQKTTASFQGKKVVFD
jgi:hypothetical protein